MKFYIDPTVSANFLLQRVNMLSVTGVSGTATAVAMDDCVVSAAVMRGAVARAPTARPSGAPTEEN